VKMQPTKVRHAVVVARHKLAVDDERAHAWQARQGVGYPRDAAGKVVAVLTVERGRVAMLVQLDAPAVEFNLVQPPLGARRSPALEAPERCRSERSLGRAISTALGGVLPVKFTL
jgi:hypothetical protein